MDFFAGFFLGSSGSGDSSDGDFGLLGVPLIIIIANILFKKLTNYVVINFSPYFKVLIFMYLLSLLVEFRFRFRFLVRASHTRRIKTVTACMCFSLLSIPISMILFHDGNIFIDILKYTGAGDWNVDGIFLNVLESIIYWGCKLGNVLTIAFGVTFFKEVIMRILLLISGFIVYRSSYFNILKEKFLSSSLYRTIHFKLKSLFRIV